MTRGLTRMVVAAVTVAAVGCGSSQPGPTAPATGAATAATNPSTGNANQATTRPVTTHGAVAALAGTCPTVTFTVGGAMVSTTSATTFTGGACTDVADGAVVGVEGSVASDGSILATRLVIERPAVSTPPASLHGTVASVTGTCPALSFIVGTTTVTTSSTTTFAGAGCAAIAAGELVAVAGTRAADGSIAATQVFAASPTPQPAAVRGTVASVSGTCPTLTVMVGTTTVTTSATTDFGGAGCAAVLTGAQVAVEGTRAADGSIAALHLVVAPPPPVRLHGAVSGLSGTCPAVAFTVSATTVVTTPSTRFEGGGCAAVAAGSTVFVEGTSQANGSVSATHVLVSRPGGPGF